MTLSLYGKSRKRQGSLLLLGVLAVFAAIIVATAFRTETLATEVPSGNIQVHKYLPKENPPEAAPWQNQGKGQSIWTFAVYDVDPDANPGATPIAQFSQLGTNSPDLPQTELWLREVNVPAGFSSFGFYVPDGDGDSGNDKCNQQPLDGSTLVSGTLHLPATIWETKGNGTGLFHICAYNEPSADVGVTFSKFICETYGDVPRNEGPGGTNDIGEDDGPAGLDADDLGPLGALGNNEAVNLANDNRGDCTLATDPWTFQLWTDGRADGVGGTLLQTVSVTGTQVVTLNAEALAQTLTGNGLYVEEVYQAGYGFGAIKCSVDHLNDDNWEWLNFTGGIPEGAVHCIAYNVAAEPVTTTVNICKVFEDNQDGVTRGDTTFNFEVTAGSQTEQASITLAEGEGLDGEELTDCEAVVLDGTPTVVTFTELATSITDAAGYPRYGVGSSAPAPGSTVDVTLSECVPAAADLPCTVTFVNREAPGEVSPTGDLRIEKYLDINGDGDAADVALGEGPIAAWNMTVNGPGENGVFATGAGGSVSFSGLTTGDSYTITEALPGGWTLTNVKVDGANSAVNVTKSVTIPDGGTRVVAYFNQPIGSLNVTKVALTSHNFSPDVPSPQDRDGWLITVSSAGCAYTATLPTGVNGDVSFANLPLCTDYVVSENTVNADSPEFVPVGASSVTGVTPNGQTITFTNRRATYEFLVITPTPVPPTETPVPPTETPVPPIVEPTATPTAEEDVAGEKTPGPTPLAPVTGTGAGGGGGTASANLLLVVAGLAVLSGGMTMAAVGKRRRN